MAIPEFLQQYVFNSVKEYVTDQLGYVWNYEKKVNELDEVVVKLRGERDSVRDKAEEEEGRYGREVLERVTEWLGQVDIIISQYEEFEEEDKKHAGYPLAFPNVEIRYSRSKTAEDIIERVVKLQERKPDNISRWQGHLSMDFSFHNFDYVSFESRRKTLEKIIELLGDSSSRMIGVHGPAGVGKTTLVKKAANKAREDKLFNVVIMVSMTQNPDIRMIQGQIADMLGMKLEEESEHARAVRIQERLKKKKENTLIILDDLCAKVDLNMLGIPSEVHNGGVGNEKNLILKEGKSSAAGSRSKMETNQPPEPGSTKTGKTSGATKAEKTSAASSSSSKLNAAEELYRGCKVLLISAVRPVLDHMDVEAGLIFSVKVLNDKEAEDLFKKIAGKGDKNSEFEKLAVEIAKKCHGLPMSIFTTARALKNQNHSVWVVTSRDLESQKLTGTPEYSTKLSYNLLENEELKLTFLLCARMGHDALVSDLVKYCIGLGFLQGVYTVTEARDRVQTLLLKLKQSGLMSDSYSGDHFTMQNLVRNAALSIASEEKHVFTLTTGKLDEWPDEDKLESYTAISLRHCDVIEEFPESIRCPKLRVFHVDNNDPRLKIPDNFFQQMKELRVLILTGINLSPLPSSIRCLKKLRMLCLEQCTLVGEQLRIIGELKNLRILSFSGSDIKRLPVELKHLSKLQIFDISNCFNLSIIPPDVISSLTSLEELYLRNTSIQWRVDEGQEITQSENASLSELGHLNQLKTLDIQIPSVACLPRNLFFDNLYSYKILIGSPNRYLELDFKIPEKYELSRFLAILQKDDFDIHSQKGIKMLFERVENLLLKKFNGVKDIFNELNLKGFLCLQHLSILSSSGIQYLINPKHRKHPEKAFPKLESLCLYKLESMDEIIPSSCQLVKPSFGKLKIIKIKLCDKLTNVFLVSMVRLLTALETIQVSDCSSLTEIVQEERQENADKGELKFPELRSLTLQSLPEFIGFYPISSARGSGTGILFHEKVNVSKLEKMELSSIQINQIWSDQSSCFENLIHLDVNGCWNLKYLFSLSMAKCLGKLQSLFVSECSKMVHIFPQGQGSDAIMKQDKIFPNLKNIKLSSMKSLSEIWSSEVPAGSFGKLDTLILEECDKLVDVFHRYMVGGSLSNLRVTNCKSMKAIFDFTDRKRGAMFVTKLQDVHLETLPKLKHVLKWKKDVLKRKKDEEGIPSLNNLQKLWVRDCDNLESIFPVSIAENLGNLEHLVVWDCIQLREIVAKGEGANNSTSGEIKFDFPKLTTVKFSKLPKFKSFYPEAYLVTCPLLNDLSVELCDKLKLFREETAEGKRKHISILFSEKVINNLKSMQIESQHAKSSTNYDYRRDNLEELHLSRLKNTDILYSFLHHNPNLKSLWLNHCSFEELVPLERPHEIESLGVVPNLKSLKLTDLPRLKEIGFERDAILQRIESLIIKDCYSLGTIATSSVSLTHLTNLEVVDCETLKNLMFTTTAKSLGQLRSMKVMNCASLEEIVSEQRNEDERIVFRQLKALEFVSLKSLKSFCSSKSSAFEFPALEKVVVSGCPNLEKFSEKFPQDVKSTPILQKVYVRENEKRWCWKDNLQATLQYMFHNKKYFEGMDELSVDEHVDLEQAWQGKGSLQKDWFYSLTTLKLQFCKFETFAIPSNVVHCLKTLKELEVWYCHNITSIFEKGDAKFRGTLQLKKLTLAWLHDVTHVWQEGKQGISRFQNLQQVIVFDCKKLKALFPVALARDLKKLEKLEIKDCSELLEIVAKEEEEEAAEGTKEEFVFPRLTTLELYMLPELTYFYSGRFTLECPELYTLQVRECNKLKLFQSEEEGQGSSTSVNTQPLFSYLKGISKVEELHLKWNGSSTTLPLEIRKMTPNLETMRIDECRSMKELFPSGNLQDGGKLADLKQLFLDGLSELHSMGGVEYSSSNLQLLDVARCPLLKTAFAQSISNLRELYIQECHGLDCLFTSAAAKMLLHLEELYISDCESLKEIVGKEDETTSTQQEIKFEGIERISLKRLPRLECFYSGNSTLLLPSLVQVDIHQCPRMKTFSQGRIPAESSSTGIRVSYNSYDDDDLVFHHNLNDAVAMSFLHEVTAPHLKTRSLNKEDVIMIEQGRIHVDLRNIENLILQSFDEDSDAFPDIFFKEVPLPNVQDFTVADSAFQEIFPSQRPDFDYMQILSRLKVLELRSMHKLKSIGLEHTRMAPLLESLQNLTVRECSCLTNLAPSTVSFSKLIELEVKDCARLEYLFTSSTAKSLVVLDSLSIANCESLEKVVAAEGGDKPDEDVIFRRLATLSLSELPKLGSFYTGNSTLNFPWLEDVSITQCKSMKTFYHGKVQARFVHWVKIDGIRCNGDLNTAVRQHFEKGSSPELA